MTIISSSPSSVYYDIRQRKAANPHKFKTVTRECLSSWLKQFIEIVVFVCWLSDSATSCFSSSPIKVYFTGFTMIVA